MLHTARFLCSVAAAVAHLLRELRKVLIRASAFSPVAVASPPTTAAAAASPAVGVISAMTLPLRRKTPAAAASAVAIQKQLLVVAPAPPSAAVIVGAEVPNVVGGCCGDDVAQQQAESKKKKTAWDARRRPTRLLIPVADDVGEVAAGLRSGRVMAESTPTAGPPPLPRRRGRLTWMRWRARGLGWRVELDRGMRWRMRMPWLLINMMEILSW
jgi:protein phosphatase 1L